MFQDQQQQNNVPKPTTPYTDQAMQQMNAFNQRNIGDLENYYQGMNQTGGMQNVNPMLASQEALYNQNNSNLMNQIAAMGMRGSARMQQGGPGSEAYGNLLGMQQNANALRYQAQGDAMNRQAQAAQGLQGLQGMYQQPSGMELNKANLMFGYDQLNNQNNLQSQSLQAQMIDSLLRNNWYDTNIIQDPSMFQKMNPFASGAASFIGSMMNKTGGK